MRNNLNVSRGSDKSGMIYPSSRMQVLQNLTSSPLTNLIVSPVIMNKIISKHLHHNHLNRSHYHVPVSVLVPLQSVFTASHQ